MSQAKRVITEQTAKRWKLVQLIGGVVFAFCLCMLFTLPRDPSAAQSFASYGTGAAIGFTVYAIGRFIAWWNHG